MKAMSESACAMFSVLHRYDKCTFMICVEEEPADGRALAG